MIAQTIRQTPPPQHKIDTVSIQSCIMDTAINL